MAWLIKAVNPEVPLGEAALGLIVEEVRRQSLRWVWWGAGGINTCRGSLCGPAVQASACPCLDTTYRLDRLLPLLHPARCGPRTRRT